jgi:hypothetical protein
MLVCRCLVELDVLLLYIAPLVAVSMSGELSLLSQSACPGSCPCCRSQHVRGAVPVVAVRMSGELSLLSQSVCPGSCLCCRSQYVRGAVTQTGGTVWRQDRQFTQTICGREIADRPANLSGCQCPLRVCVLTVDSFATV